MTDLIVSVTLVLVLVLAAAMVAMIVVGFVGVLSGTRVVVGCPSCGRWELDTAGAGAHLCAHCAHPGRFRWEPALLHPHRSPTR